MLLRLLVLALLVSACYRPVGEKRKPCQGGNAGAIELSGAVNEKIIAHQPTPGNSNDKSMAPKQTPHPKVTKLVSQKVTTLGTSTVTLEGPQPDFTKKIVADTVILKNVQFEGGPDKTLAIEIEANDLILEGGNSITAVGPHTRIAKVTAPPIKIKVHNAVSGDGELSVASKGLNCH